MKRVSFLHSKPAQLYKNIRIMADTGLHEEIARLIQARIEPGTKVLDYGAGEGALSQRLVDLGYQVLAADIDQGKFKANTEFVAVDFDDPHASQAFGATYPERFDLVLSIEVIEHVENPWKYVRDLKRLARPGGYIIISTPNVTSWYSRLEFFFRGRLHQFDDSDLSYGHINPIFQNELRLISSRTGLVVEDIIPAGWLPRLWLSNSPKRMLLNLIGFVGTFFMKGLWDGWCLIAVIRKPLPQAHE